MPSTGPGSKWMSAIRCSYACTSGPWEPRLTTPPGTGGRAAHGGWMIVVGAGAGVVGAGAVVVVGAGAVVVAGRARFVAVSSRSAEPATAMPETKSAATTNETSTGGRKTCLRGRSCRRSEVRIVPGRTHETVPPGLRTPAPAAASLKLDRAVK